MIRAAGILLLDKQGQALFLQRGPEGDHVGEWCIPGGKIEDNETALEAACRECKEECGYVCRPESCQEYTRRIKDGVDFTTFCCEIKDPFTVQIGSEVSAFAWASPKNPPQPLHPGCAVVVNRQSMNELDIAHAIRDQELVSPQKYENVWLFDMRITGTGLAYRHKFEEFAWRDKSLYLNPEFLARCNGLPVILEHPQSNILNTKEYNERNVGSVFLPYIKGDEVWGIVKIWDEPTAKMMLEDKLSTSPAVVWRDPKSNVEAELESGEKFFVEGKPSLLDHLAICEQGVWDKGGVPEGISTTATGVTAMPDDVRKDEKAAADSAAKATDTDQGALMKLMTTAVEGIKSLTSRMDSVETKLATRSDDATVKNRVLADDDDDAKKRKDSKAKADDDDDKGRKDDDDAKKRKDDDDDKGRKDALPPQLKDDSKGRKDAKAKADDDDDDKGRKDDDDDDKGRKDDNDDKIRKAMDEVGDPKKLAADKKRGDDDDDDRKDSRGDSVVIRRADYDNLRQRIDKMEGRIPQLSDEDIDALARVQSRADHVYSHFGMSASRPMHGEKLIDYRRRLVTKMQQQNIPEVLKNINLRVAAVDEANFNMIEAEIYKAAVDAARNPSSVPVGTLREHIETKGGHTFTRFYGRPVSWMGAFAPGGRRVKRINQLNKGGNVNA